MGDVPINNVCLHCFISMLYVYVNVQDVCVNNVYEYILHEYIYTF